MAGRLIDAYRRTGADVPFGRPERAHGTALEGYYWRIVDARAGRVIVVLCGISRTRGERWATVALAGHPGGFVRHAAVAPAAAAAEGFGTRAGDVLRGSLERLRARLEDDAWIDVRLRPRVPWPRRALGGLGVAQAAPGLPQYWHPLLLRADVEGEARLGDATVRLDGGLGYVEKNWGSRFPDQWWWGHASAFPQGEVDLAFAGGPVTLGPVRIAPAAVTVRLGAELLRLAPPLAVVRSAATRTAWHVRARSARHAVQVEGGGDGHAAHVLPVPDVHEPRVRMRSHQHLAGRVRLRVRRGGRILFDGESPLAGLELGVPPGVSGRPPGAPPR